MSYVDPDASGVKGVSTNVGYSNVEYSHTAPQQVNYSTTYANDSSAGYQYSSSGARGATQVVNGPTTYTTTTGPVQTVGYSTTQYGSNVVGGHSHVVGGQSHVVSGGSYGGHQKAVAEDIPVESRIEYIPFEKKYVEYDRVERVERIPYEREIVEYEEITVNERVPVERTITDYYAVETQVEYIPKEIEETIVEYEPVERTWERVQYLPVETQIIHYPERERYTGQGSVQTSGAVHTHGYTQGGYAQSGYAQGGYTTGQTTYTSSNVPAGGYTTGGYTTGQTTYSTGPIQTAQSGYREQVTYGSGSGAQYVSGQSGSQYVSGSNAQYGSGSGVQYVSGGQSSYVSGQAGQSSYVSGQPGQYVETTQYVSQPGTTYAHETYVSGSSGHRNA